MYIDDGKVLGFSFATLDNSQLFKNLGIHFDICFALLKKPWIAKKILFHLRKNRFPPAPERAYSATHLNVRRRGIGKRLHKAVDEEFQKRNVSYYVIRIDADNVPNLNLTQSFLGAKIKEEFTENGIRKFLLYRTLDS